jgi:CheY-like chemotaxis protein
MSPQKILLVEDKKNWQKSIFDLLKPLNVNCQLATSYEEALGKLKEENFDVLILNLCLTGNKDYKGKYILESLYSKRSYKVSMYPPCIILTGQSGSMGEFLQRYEIYDIFNKGRKFDKMKFFEVINACLHENRNKKGVTFDVFLAHNSKDKSHIEVIAERLKQQGIKTWIDKEQIPPGTPFQDVIQQALPKVRSTAIFIGQSGMGNWELEELRVAIDQSVKRSIPVIPVLLPGVDKIPESLPFLSQRNQVVFRNLDDAEALDKLVWGITGKHPSRS